MLKITIEDYPVFMKLGYHSQERYQVQYVLVSVDADIGDERDPGTSDDLTRALDYGAITAFIDELLTKQECKLIETVVNRVGYGLMERFPHILSSAVKVEKTCLPQGVTKTSRIRISKRFDRDTIPQNWG